MRFFIILFCLCSLGLLLSSCGEGKEAEASAQNPSMADSLSDSSSPGQVDTIQQPTVLVLGNSIAAGYGLEMEQAFPHLLQEKIDSLGLPHRVINAGLSGETTTAGVNRLPWLLRQPIDVLVIELGGNDGLRGIPPQETRANLEEMVRIARDRYPDIAIILCGMLAPPNMGQDYTQRFQQIFPSLAQELDLALVPFVLEGVAGEPELNQSDGIHPTPEGHRIVAENVWQVLRPIIEQSRKSSLDP